MKKKIIAAALAISMMTTLAVGMTLAYFTDARTAKNTFTVGNVKIELTEPGWKSSGSKDAPTVYAGERLKKDPTVSNTGANPCFVRIKVDGLNSLGNGLMITYRSDTDGNKDGLDDNWTLHTDGYYYYNTILEANRPENKDENGTLLKPIETPKLFDQIIMPTGLTGDKGDTPKEYHVTVTAEAIQAQGAMTRWDDVKNMKVPEIAKWFSDNMPAATNP